MHRPPGFISGFQAVGVFQPELSGERMRNTVRNPQRRGNEREQSRADLFLHLLHFNTDHGAAVWGQESDWK